GAGVEHEGGAVGVALQHPAVEPELGPAPQHLGLALRQVGSHREVGARKIQCGLVVHGRRRDRTSGIRAFQSAAAPDALTAACDPSSWPVMATTVSKAVLITGCSTAIGRATAEHLVRSGWTFYATAS